MWAWAGLNSRSEGSRTFFYRFSHTPLGEEGATHGAEMCYVSDHLEPNSSAWPEVDRRLAELMSSYWANFARTGDPNGEGLPEWPKFTRSGEIALLIGGEIQAGRVPKSEYLVSIDRLYGAVRFLLEFGYILYPGRGGPQRCPAYG